MGSDGQRMGRGRVGRHNVLCLTRLLGIDYTFRFNEKWLDVSVSSVSKCAGEPVPKVTLS